MPLCEKRRLGACVVTAPFLARAGDVAAREARNDYEEAMSAVRCRFGHVGVAAAIAKLKDTGRVDLARRFRLASSRRNKQTHPHSGLDCEIRMLASGDVMEHAGSTGELEVSVSTCSSPVSD